MKTKTITPKIFKKNCKVALKEAKEELVKAVLNEQEASERKLESIRKLEYWESMSK